MIVFLIAGILSIVFYKQLSKMIVEHHEKMKKMGVVPKLFQSKRTHDEEIKFHNKVALISGIIYIIIAIILNVIFDI